jgi:chemotaxis protein methyltransferase CheR
MEYVKDIEIEEVRKITGIIQSKYKYDFSEYALSSFKRRINRILNIHHFTNVDQLIDKLILEPDYFHTFLSELTVNVTEMFRDHSFWLTLRKDILIPLFKEKEKVRIWHAGCSSGEEVFSMAIYLKEMGVLNRTSIIASDIDKDILAKAKAGKYNIKNMDVNTKNYERAQGKFKLSAYYQQQDNFVTFDPTLLENIIFKEYNLTSQEAFSKFDLVLCRNVLIYFNQNLQNKVLKSIHESLFINSYLAIGSKESLIWCDHVSKFNCINNEEKIYKKVKE